MALSTHFAYIQSVKDVDMIDIRVGTNETKPPFVPDTGLTGYHEPSSGTLSGRRLFSGKARPVALFLSALLAYLLLAALAIDHKYVDYGDGNYLYISWRLAEGEVLYKDMPSPQPPLLLFLGSWLLFFTNGDPILVRLWQILQHALTACCVYGIAARLFNRPRISAWAGILFLFLPEGVWWSAGFQSEPLLILLQSFNVLLLLGALEREKPSTALYGAALFSVLTCFTNMTALPYAALQWFFVWLHFRRLFLAYSLAFLVPGFLGFVGMMIYSHGQYVDDIFFRQVGTYPADSLGMALSYFIGKLYQEGGDILFWEGGFVFAALAGILLYAGDESRARHKSYMIWWAVFSAGSIIFVTKGGTVEYIFTIGEPAVAVFSAYFLVHLFQAAGVTFQGASLKDPLHLGKAVLLLCLFLPALLMKPASLLYRTFSGGPISFSTFYEGSVFELSSAEMDKVTLYIQRHCPPEKQIISPPYYAFMAKRKIAQNATCLFILAHAYFNEWEKLSRSRDLSFSLPTRNQVRVVGGPADFTYEVDYNTQAIYDLAALFQNEPALQTEYPVIYQFLKVREDIMNRRVGLILKNTKHLYYAIHPLHQALRDFCEPLEPQLELNNREEKIVFYRVK